MDPKYSLVFMFSIIIPFLDRIELLCKTIKYFKKQTYQDWELILVDDGSCEKGLEKVFLFIEADKNIRYLKRPESLPAGGNGARNYGMEQAQNDWVIFYDSDDILFPLALEKRASVLSQFKANDLYIFNTGFFDETKNEFNADTRLPLTIEACLGGIFKIEAHFQTGSMVWRKTFLQEIGGWNVNLKCFQDYEVFIRAVFFSKKIWIDSSSDILHFYRVNIATSIAGGYKSARHKMNAFDASLQIENFLDIEQMNRFDQFIKKFFVEWSVLHLGLTFPLKFVFKRPFYQSISRLDFVGWCLDCYVSRLKMFVGRKLIHNK